MDPSDLVSATSAAIAARGADFYFSPPTLERGKSLGLDGFRFYFLGRGGVLGDVEWPVVYSAFGYFHPALVAKIWDSARQVVAPREAGRVHHQACADFGRAHLSEVEGLGEFCEAARAVADAVDPAGLSLFAAWSAEPLAPDVGGRAQQLVSLLREHRGSAHLMAVVASGLSPRIAHYLRRPGDFASFGWSEEEVPVVTDDERAKWAAAEALTDRLVLPAYSSLDDAGRQAFLAGVEAIDAALAAAD